jgi:hypothetical protein
VFDGNTNASPAKLPFPGKWTSLINCAQDYYYIVVTTAVTLNITVTDNVTDTSVDFSDQGGDASWENYCITYSENLRN